MGISCALLNKRSLAAPSLLCALFLTISSSSTHVLAFSLQPSLQPIQQSTQSTQQQQQGASEASIARGILDSLSGISGQQQQAQPQAPPQQPSSSTTQPSISSPSAPAAPQTSVTPSSSIPPPSAISPPPAVPPTVSSIPQQQQQGTSTATTTSEGMIARGIIDSLIFTPTATWIATGNWTIGVNNGVAALVTANMTWYNDNGTASHTHEILNFKPTEAIGGQQEPILVQPADNSVSLRGVVDVGANHRIAWNDVQSTIDIKKGGKILSISLDDAKTNNHFGGRPIYGIVTSFIRCSDVPGPNMEMPTPCLNIPTPATPPAVSAAPSLQPTTAAPVSPPSPSPPPPTASNATGKSPFDILGGG